MKGVHAQQLPRYVDEFLWREQFGRTAHQAFASLIGNIAPLRSFMQANPPTFDCYSLLLSYHLGMSSSRSSHVIHPSIILYHLHTITAPEIIAASEIIPDITILASLQHLDDKVT